MPIGKNAIKRVENNGYSKVKTSAPDMENSNVIANLDPQVMEKMVAPVEAAAKEVAVAKTAAKKPAAKKAPTKKTACKKTAKNGFERVSLCEDMPYYLL
ncbi:MAG: hypothetical protein IJ329_01715 [Clostridia bacterium]|nr:hypothetical protein [Clostridia bacterium]